MQRMPSGMVQPVVCAGLVVALALGAATAAAAQQPTRRRQAPIEIRGQVPTPQVVTVRPREVPNYSRQVLVPNFYNHDFWQSILPAYQVVPRRAIQGNRALDSLVKDWSKTFKEDGKI